MHDGNRLPARLMLTLIRHFVTTDPELNFQKLRPAHPNHYLLQRSVPPPIQNHNIFHYLVNQNNHSEVVAGLYGNGDYQVMERIDSYPASPLHRSRHMDKYIDDNDNDESIYDSIEWYELPAEWTWNVHGEKKTTTK